MQKEQKDQSSQPEEKIYQIRSNPMQQMLSQINRSMKAKIQELKTYIIFAVGVICVVSYLFYDSMRYMREEIRNTSAQIDVVLSQNTVMQKNMKALAGTLCYNCHNTTVMFLPKTSLSLPEFTKYVRGERFVTNSVMPIFTEKDIPDSKLQDIWKNLY